MRVAGLFLCGYTASPPHVKLEKTSLGTVRFVPWKRFDTAPEAVGYLKERGVEVWGAETTSHSITYYEAVVPPKVAVVFGNEALGVSSGVLDICDRLIEIPAYGFKNSLNVATACSVIGYRILESMNNKKARN